MDHLAKELPMLVSAINFLLRDEIFDSLDQICFAFDEDKDNLLLRLEKAGYKYDSKQKRLW